MSLWCTLSTVLYSWSFSFCITPCLWLLVWGILWTAMMLLKRDNTFCLDSVLSLKSEFLDLILNLPIVRLFAGSQMVVSSSNKLQFSFQRSSLLRLQCWKNWKNLLTLIHTCCIIIPWSQHPSLLSTAKMSDISQTKIFCYSHKCLIIIMIFL